MSMPTSASAAPPASPAQDMDKKSLLLPKIEMVLCAPYTSDARYPGGFNDIFSSGFLPNFAPLNTATMLALDEHHGGLPVCLALQPDSRGALDLFYRDLSGAGGTQRIGVPPRFLLKDDLPDRIRWAKTERFEACHLPKDSLSPYAPVELIIRLPREWYTAKKDQLNCVMFMPYFMAVTERSEEQGVSARTVDAKFVICYPRQQNPLLSTVARAFVNAASEYGKSSMRLDRQVLGVTYGFGLDPLHENFKSDSLSILGNEDGRLKQYVVMD